MARKKINYLKVIIQNDLEDDFNFYCIKHKDISLKRNAYNFVRSQTCIRTGRNPWIEACEKAKAIDSSEIGDVVYGEARFYSDTGVNIPGVKL